MLQLTHCQASRKDAHELVVKPRMSSCIHLQSEEGQPFGNRMAPTLNCWLYLAMGYRCPTNTLQNVTVEHFNVFIEYTESLNFYHSMVSSMEWPKIQRIHALRHPHAIQTLPCMQTCSCLHISIHGYRSLQWRRDRISAEDHT